MGFPLFPGHNFSDSKYLDETASLLPEMHDLPEVNENYNCGLPRVRKMA